MEIRTVSTTDYTIRPPIQIPELNSVVINIDSSPNQNNRINNNPDPPWIQNIINSYNLNVINILSVIFGIGIGLTISGFFFDDDLKKGIFCFVGEGLILIVTVIFGLIGLLLKRRYHRRNRIQPNM